MDLTSKLFLKNILKEKDIRPNKKLGQNFLVSRTILNKVVKTANIKKTDVILEIGPGIGTLTQELAKRAKKVIAIEKDKRLVEILKQTLKDFNNVEIIKGNILKINSKQQTINNKEEKLLTVGCLLFTDYKIIANLPYYITSPVIRNFLEAENSPKQMILMVQKEVAQRIMAKPPRMNLLAVAVQFYSKPEIICYVSKKCFWPVPKVDSAIIQLTVNSKQLTPKTVSPTGQAVNSKQFFKIVKAGFAHPRKQLVNNLSNGLKLDKHETEKWLLKNDVEPKQRAQTLNLENWINLAKTLKNKR